MDNFVITIARQYGSGGRTVGEMLAKKLGIGYYDKDIRNTEMLEIRLILLIKVTISAWALETVDHEIRNSFWKSR